jgi:hypothetical protein
MGNPFLFADRFSGAVVHLTTGRPLLRTATFCFETTGLQKQKMPAAVELTQAFDD